MKNANDSLWSSPFPDTDKGPSFSVLTGDDGTVWMGTWNGIYIFKNNTLQHLKGTNGPIAVMCRSEEGIYAAGTGGIWLCQGEMVEQKTIPLPGRSAK